MPAVLNREVPRPHRHRQRRRGDRDRARTGRARKASSAASPPAPPSRRRSRSRARPAAARWSWRCCPTPASAICPRRCSRASPMARIRNPEVVTRSVVRRGSSRAPAGAARRDRMSEPLTRRAARPVRAVPRRRAAPARIAYETWGTAERRARQRDTAVHRPVALGARRRHRARSRAGLVAAHDRPGPGAGHRPLFRRLRQFARQLLRLHRRRPRSIRPPASAIGSTSPSSRSRTSRAPAIEAVRALGIERLAA